MSTRYNYVLQEGPELEAAKVFLENDAIETPIVVAKREGEMVGALATQTSGGAVVAGPLKVSVKPGGFIALRLGKLYELLLKEWGITEYLIGVKDGVDKGWKRAMLRMGSRYGEKEEYTWIKRKIGDFDG